MQTTDAERGSSKTDPTFLRPAICRRIGDADLMLLTGGWRGRIESTDLDEMDDWMEAKRQLLEDNSSNDGMVLS